jgi:histone deacetylase 11
MRWRVLNPLLYGTEGTILSALVAVDKGWSVNLSGGYHHASYNRAMGFCIYADISLCVHYLRTRLNMKRIMIIDLDAHQGNGHGSDALGDPDIYIIDAHNPEIFPGDTEAARAIR